MPISGNFQAFNARVQPWRQYDTHVPTQRHDDPASAAKVPGLVEGKSSGSGAPFASGGLVSVMRALGINRDVSRNTDSPSQVVRGGAFSGTQPYGSEHDMSGAGGYRPGSQVSPVARGGTSEWAPIGGGRVPAWNGQRPAWFPVNHAATAATRGAYSAQFHGTLSNYANPRAYQGRGDAARAHGDTQTARVTGANYRAQPAQFAGEVQSQDRVETKGYSTGFTGSMLAKQAGTDGFPSSDGGETTYTTKYRTRGTHDRNWFVADYSSPTLGAMYSQNTPRGVLPNTVATPFPQPPVSGYKASGIAPNQRQLLKRFVTPTLYRTPPSEAATISVVNDGGAPANTLGLGF